MMALIVFLILALAGLLGIVTFVQTLYAESLRLRSRELPSMAFFKNRLEEAFGLKPERAILTYSLIRHSTVLILGLMPALAALLRPSAAWVTLIEAYLACWLLLILAGFAIPQMLYRTTQGRWVIPLIPFLRALASFARPVVAVLEFFQSLFETTQFTEEEAYAGDHVEHIDALISAGAEEGLFEEEDRKLIQAAVAFGDKTVREVMTPRPNIVAIEASRSLEDLRQLLINEQYSRVPVYEETIDRIIGFVHARDMFELDDEERKGHKVRDLLRPVRLVPETKRVNDLLREMQEDRAHMAIVIDEYGNTAGLVTLEDLVEEILGEIRDEHEPEVDVKEDSSGRYVISGSCSLDRLRELLDFRPREKTESTTVGGLVAEWLGKVPSVGDVVERDGIRLEILAGNERRVEQVRVGRIEEASRG
jgi:CBS domain containing-hemolysin-like protein